ncbi:MAG: glycosyltransferase family 2 protein [Beijerinckiaceae bacterium]
MVEEKPRCDLTFILPVYNDQDGVSRALDSIVVQAIWPEQVIVVDDGSPTSIYLHIGLPAEFPVTLIRHKKNRGAAAARNTGMKASRTEWISFLDSDDWLISDTLAQRWQFLIHAQSTPRAIAKTIFGCGWVDCLGNGKKIGQRMPRASQHPNDFAAGCWFAPGSCIFINRRCALGLVGGQDEVLGRYEDVDWFLSLAIKGFHFKPQAIVGAMITRKRQVDPAVSQRSVHTIIHKWRTSHLPVDMMRRLEAYLALEQAAAFFFSGRILKSAKFIFMSLWHMPRLRLQFSPGWDRRAADADTNCAANSKT